MKNLFLLLGLFITVTGFSQTRDDNGVITPGPPWETGVQQGSGELILQFEYMATSIDTAQTMLQDSLGWFNVISYGADPTGVANSTSAIQSAINASVRGTVYFPPGSYLVDSLYINRNVNLLGVSGDYSSESNVSQLKANLNKPIIYIDSSASSFFGSGGSIKDLVIRGLDDGDSTNQHGIVHNTVNRWLINKVSIVSNGGYGIKLGDGWNTAGMTVDDCLIRWNHIDGIYGRDLGGNQQVNGITIQNSSIIDNYRHGINLIGKDVDILNNKIELNDSTGLFMSARDVGDVDCNSLGTMVRDNHFEDNTGGEIIIHFYSDGGGNLQYHYQLTIEENTFHGNAGYDKPEATAMISLDSAFGSADVAGFIDLTIGKNFYTTSQGHVYVDGGDVLESDTRIYLTREDDTSTDFINLKNASTFKYGGWNAGEKFAGITAATGVPESRLAPYIYIDQSSDGDISANPQIADGFSNGQTITFVKSNVNNPLIFENGNGLEMPGGTFSMNQFDVISFKYSSSKDVWIEQFRSRPYWENITVTSTINQTQISHSLTDGTPTDAEIDAATGTTPAGAGAGAMYIILDSDGSALLYRVVSDGSNWQFVALTIAS